MELPDLLPDENQEDADWLKRTWDIPAKNVKQLKAYLLSQGITVRHFKTLPVYKMNVKKLSWLKDL